ncbi:MAG: XTP/dITP diphosphatase [bacterium]
MKILIATHNQDKLREIRVKVASLDVTILSQDDFTDFPHVEEDGETLEANAIKKGLALAKLADLPALADDTGLEVDALDGAPGVFSARYSGPGATYDSNCDKLLREMVGVPDEKRTARFRTVLAFVEKENIKLFEGIVEGTITRERRGSNGFGYDPVFFATEKGMTLAEMSLEEKNVISHRGVALEKWVAFLKHDRGL